MIYRSLGKTGIKVSVIGIGTWQYGGEWGVDFTQRDIDAILDEAAMQGINLIDTAECYGDHLSEKLIGDYLDRNNRERWTIATKFGHSFHDKFSRSDAFSPASVLLQLDRSLKALKIETIDLYQFHSGPDVAFQNDELWTMLDKQKQSGKIRHLGCSLNKTTQIQAEKAHQYGIEVIQVLYNRLERNAEERHLPAALKNNLGVLARVPLASGFLTGKYSPGAVFPQNDTRSRQDQDFIQSQLTEAERIRQTEVPADIPMSQWAISWCLRRQEVSAVIPGCKDLEQVRSNAAAVNFVA